jgi:hypothetical protein
VSQLLPLTFVFLRKPNLHFLHIVGILQIGVWKGPLREAVQDTATTARHCTRSENKTSHLSSRSPVSEEDDPLLGYECVKEKDDRVGCGAISVEMRVKVGRWHESRWAGK